MIAALALSLLLTQEEPAPAPEAAEAAPAAEASEASKAPAEAAAPAEAKAPQVKGADEAARLVSKWASLSTSERTQALQDLAARLGGAPVNAVLPPAHLDFNEWVSLSESEQAKRIAHDYLAALRSADASGALRLSALPFWLEDRRFFQANDLSGELERQLKRRRVDLWTVHDINVYTPQEMEKRYGKPPQRLSSWSWRANKAVLAVANVSGHAAVLLLRQVGATWQVQGFTD